MFLFFDANIKRNARANDAFFGLRTHGFSSIGPLTRKRIKKNKKISTMDGIFFVFLPKN